MNHIRRRFPSIAAIAMAATPLLVTNYLLFWSPSDLSAAAGVPVIVVDAPIQASQLAACSVLSDNYQAGVLCAQHLLPVRDSANIAKLSESIRIAYSYYRKSVAA